MRARGQEPRFGNLVPEFERVVREAHPQWFLMENVRRCPDPEVAGFSVCSFHYYNAWLCEKQMRHRRFWFGWRQIYGPAPNLQRWMPGAALMDPRRVTAVAGHDGTADWLHGSRKAKAQGKKKKPPHRSIPERLELQGLPGDFFEGSPLTLEGKRHLLSNAVPLPQAKALARAVGMAWGSRIPVEEF